MKKSTKNLPREKSLTLQEEAFCEAYIQNGGNGTAAVKTAGYKGKAGARVTASRLLTRANISENIAKRRAELRKASDVSAQEVIQALAAHLRSDITQLLSKGGAFDLEHVREAGLGRLIKKIELKWVAGKPARVTPKGTAVKATAGKTYVAKIELHSAQSAASQLCKVLGINQEPGKNKNDPETIQRMLDERIQFGIDGFAHGGVKHTRHSMLKLFEKMPENLLPGMMELITAELASETIQ